MIARLLMIFILWQAHTTVAGIVINGTRIIYNEGLREHALKIANANLYPILFQPWVDHGEGSPNKHVDSFIIVPPFFKMEANEINTIRMIHDGSGLPSDRESVFWLNLYEIPLLDNNRSDHHYLNMAMNTQIKLFFRPKNLKKMNIEEIIQQVRTRIFSDEKGSYVMITNPTPYHVSILDVKLIDQSLNVKAKTIPNIDTLVAPFSSKNYDLDHQILAPELFLKIKITLIDDSGRILDFDQSIDQTTY